jgi:hypothetical protein
MNEQTKTETNEMTNKPKYRNHPVADLFPPMTETEYHELRASIQREGQHHPIVVDGDELLDGRHRLRACAELGIEPRVIQFRTLGLTITSAAWIVSTNAHRRHLTPDQKLAILSACDAWILQARTQSEASQGNDDGAGIGKAHSATSETECACRNQHGNSSTTRRRGRPAGNGKGRQHVGLAKAADQSQYRARQMLKLRKRMPELAAEVEAGRLTLKEAMRRFTQHWRKQACQTKPAATAQANEEDRAAFGFMPYHLTVRIVSLLMTADLVIQFTDIAPGKEQRRQRIAELARDFKALAGYDDATGKWAESVDLRS